MSGRREMILAALGHDLYEDSAIPRAEVAGVAEFVERVASGSEEARLIKLCDGIDNYCGLVENGLLRDEPDKWVETVRRQMEPMFNRIDGISFQKYPVAGKWLTQELAIKRESLWTVVRELFREAKEKCGEVSAQGSSIRCDAFED